VKSDMVWCNDDFVGLPDFIERSLNEYKLFFGEIVESFPHIDSMENKILFVAPAILKKILDFVRKEPKKDQIFLNGNAAFMFSKRSFATQHTQKITDMSVESRGAQGMYVSIDAHRLDKIELLLATIKRSMPSENTMHVAPLLYPPGGFGFIDPWKVKEMKGAGVVLLATKDIFATQTTYESDTGDVLYSLSPTGTKYMAINYYLMPQYRIELTFDSYLSIKRRYPHVCVCVYKNFVNFMFVDNLPIVYISNYGIYVSVYELGTLFPSELKPHVNTSSVMTECLGEFRLVYIY